MKKVLVIGGSYFAGRVFVEEYLTCQDAEIHLFNRGRSPLGFEGVIEHQGDRENPEDIRGVIPDEAWDAIIDFCAYNPAHVKSLLENIKGSVKHYILISTTSVYHEGLTSAADESFPVLTGRQPELGMFADYGFDKLQAESVLKTLCKEKRINYTILRPSIIYGFYNYTGRESYFYDAIINGGVIVLPENNLSHYSMVSVVDMAHIIVKSIGNEKTYGEVFNVSGKELLSYEGIIDVLEETIGNTLSVEYRSMDEITSDKVPLPFPPGTNLIYDGSKVADVLDFNYTAFEVGFKLSFLYYRQVATS